MSSESFGKENPFIKRREVTMWCPNGHDEYWEKNVPQRIKERVCHELWPPEKTARYLDTLRTFGFNSIQISDLTQAYVQTGVSREDLRVKNIHLLKAARERGMTASLLITATFCFDPTARDPRYPISRFDLCWHDQVDRARLEEHYRYQSDYAPYVDHIVTHWADPGGGKEGCERCNYRGALELHNAVRDVFRKRNPRIRTTFSTWMLGSSRWNRWPGLNLDTILHSGFLAPDVGIAIGLMNCGADGQRLDTAGQLNREEVAAIRETGRTAGIWSWYTADREVLPSLHVLTDILRNYFHSLVEPSGGHLDWHSIDDNCHGFNLPNLYVAGRLMRNPDEDARVVLAEFLRLYFGEEAAPAMAEALSVLEKARSESLRYAVQVGDPSEELQEPYMRRTRELTGTTAWRKSILAMAEKAAGRLERVGVRAGHVPPFPVPLAPADYVEEVRAHLRAIAQLMQFLLETDRVWQMIRQDDPADAVRTAIARLPEVDNSNEHLVHLERWVAHRITSEFRKRVPACPIGV